MLVYCSVDPKDQKVADLSLHFRKQTIRHRWYLYMDLNIGELSQGETRLGFFGPNLQPCGCFKDPIHLLSSHPIETHGYHMSHEKKTSYFPLYCLFNRDPYNGLLKSQYNWAV